MTTLVEWTEKNGIKMELERTGFRSDWTGEGIHYNVTLMHGTEVMRFQFSTGIGWIKNIKTGERAQGYHWDSQRKMVVPDNARLQWQFTEAQRKYAILAPGIEDILECLASDSNSYISAGSFEDWARDMGYDSDSRSAETQYRTLGDQAKQFRNLLGQKLYNELVLDEGDEN